MESLVEQRKYIYFGMGGNAYDDACISMRTSTMRDETISETRVQSYKSIKRFDQQGA